MRLISRERIARPAHKVIIKKIESTNATINRKHMHVSNKNIASTAVFYATLFLIYYSVDNI